MSSESLVRTAYPRIAGWRKRKTSLLEFYKCPGCGRAQESLLLDENDSAECFSCNKRFPKVEFGTAKVRRTVVECGNCGADVSMTFSNANMLGIGYICSNCNSFVAVEFGAQLLDPVEVLKQSWNPSVEKHGIPVDNDLTVFKCRTKKEYLIVQLLQILAKEEEKSFRSVTSDGDFSVGLLFDSSKKQLAGSLIWNVEWEHAILRQIFIVPDERRRGLAERMVVFWVKEYADKISDRFGIEAPNEKARSLHAKLGHIKIDGDTATGVKCFFAPTM